MIIIQCHGIHLLLASAGGGAEPYLGVRRRIPYRLRSRTHISGRKRNRYGLILKTVVRKRNRYGLIFKIVVRKRNRYGLILKIVVRKRNRYGLILKVVVRKRNRYGCVSKLGVRVRNVRRKKYVIS